jgi:predicted permease
METLLGDLRYTARTLKSKPTFTTVVVLTIALGIGINTAIFTMFYLFFRPLPVSDAERVVKLEFWEDPRVSFIEYAHFRDQTNVFSDLAASFNRSVVLADQKNSEVPQQVIGGFVSSGLFSILEAKLSLGRTFTSEEDSTPGKDPVVILSYGLWQSRFGGNPNILNEPVRLNGMSFEVVGVTASDFVRCYDFGAMPDIWLPVTMRGKLYPDSDKTTGMEWYDSAKQKWLLLYGRLKPGRTTEEGRAEIMVLVNQLSSQYPDMVPKDRVSVTGLTILGGHVQRTFWKDMTFIMSVVLAATALVLIMVCANVATLLFTRAASRQKEIGIRLCLGASRGRLIRQLLTESFVLAFLGGCAGLLLSWWSLRTFLASGLLSAYGRSDLSKVALLNIYPDVRVLVFTLGLTLLTALAFGLAPALRATRTDLVMTLKDEGASFGRRIARSRVRSALVVAQVTLCLVLLIATGLLLRGLIRVQDASPSFDPNNMSVLKVNVRANRYDEGRARQFYEDLTTRLEALPGAQSVSRALSVPGSESEYASIVSVGGEETPGNQSKLGYYNAVTPNYFDTIDTPVIHGRGFTEEERRTGASVALVNESMAKFLWPDQDPLNSNLVLKRVPIKSPIQVIGVVKDSQNVFGEIQPLFYFPLLPSREREGDGFVLTRTSSDAKQIQSMEKSAVQSLDPTLSIRENTVADYLADSSRMTNARAASALSASLALLALLLATMGLYGVMAYSVAQRTSEIGIRMALGASRKDVLRLVLGQGMLLVGIGLVLGNAGAAVVCRVLSSLLFGLTPFDAVAYVSVSVFLAAVSLLAIYIPARRAASINPLTALRQE